MYKSRCTYIFIVNKNDGDLKSEASKTASDYKSAISYYKKSDDTADKEVLLVSAIEQTGMEKVIETIQNIVSQNKKNKNFDERRAKQFTYWIEEEVREIIQFKQKQTQLPKVHSFLEIRSIVQV